MMIRKKILPAALAALLLVQLICPVFAHTPTVQPYRLVYNDRTEEGDLLPAYYVDADGNVVPSPEPEPEVEAAAESFPAKYDLRNQNVVTSVKNQAGAWNCWAFAAVSCMEISYIRQGLGTASNTDFSEAHLIWFGHRGRVSDLSDPTWGDGVYHSNPFVNGGNWEEAASTIMRGSGMQLESNAQWIDSYEPSVLMGMAQPESDRYVSYARLWQAMQIPESKLSISAIKSRIMDYGGIEIYYYDDFNFGNKAFNNQYHSYYQTDKVKVSNHAVTLIGWDDTFPRSHFNKTAPSDGAWLVKGSWSEGYGNSGYCWLSYCDPSIMKCASFAAAPADIYDNIYQYDGAYPTMAAPVEATAKEANIFTAQKAERLTHVCVYSGNEQTMIINVRVYVDEDGKYNKNIKDPTNGMRLIEDATTTIRDMEYGYRTIPLNRMVDLKAGQKFTIVATYTDPSHGQFNLPMEGKDYTMDGVRYTYGGDPGESFINIWGDWDDTNESMLTGTLDDYNNVPIKAMTQDLESQEPTLSVATLPTQKEYYVGDTLNTAGLTLRYTDGKGRPYTVTSDYQCDPSILSTEGTQEITVSYKGLQTTFTVQVQPVTLSLVDKTVSIRVGQTKQLTLQKKPSSLQVRWASDNTSVVTVSADGLLRAVSAGETTVRGSATYNGKSYSVSCAVTVTDPEVRALRMSLAQTVYVGDTLRIPSIDVVYKDGSTAKLTEGFDYNPKTLENPGAQVITLTFGKWTDTYTVQVQPLSLTLDRQSVSMMVGQSTTLTASAQPTGLKITWKSSNSAVATVNDNGEVQARGSGNAIIRATLTNGTKQCIAQCTVHISQPPTLSIRNPSTTTLKYGQTLTLHAQAGNLPTGARILWTENGNLSNGSGPSSDTYTVEARKTGTVTVTAYLVDASGNLLRGASGNPITASKDITMRCGLLQKIGGFFRKLFGIRTHFPDDVSEW